MPVYIVALIISIGAVGFNELDVPRTNRMFQTIVGKENMNKATPHTQKHIVLKAMSGDELGTLMYARSYHAETTQLSMVTVPQFCEGGKLHHVDKADNAIWNGQYWVVQSGIIYHVSAGGGVHRTMEVQEQTFPIKTAPNDIHHDPSTPADLTIKG